MDTILIWRQVSKTIELLRQEGYEVRALPTDGIGKLDAGLSCMSLRWSKST